MAHHGKETFALTELMSSIDFSPQELRRLRFEADEGLTSHSEANERLITRKGLKWMDRNTLHGISSRPYTRCGVIPGPGYEEMDDLKSWMKREMGALKRELKDIMIEKEKREVMEARWNNENDQYDADDGDEGFYQPHQPSPKFQDDGDIDLKTWMREELGQVKKELQDAVLGGKCKCTGKEDVGTEEGERSPRTVDDQGRRSATALAETAV